MKFKLLEADYGLSLINMRPHSSLNIWRINRIDHWPFQLVWLNILAFLFFFGTPQPNRKCPLSFQNVTINGVKQTGEDQMKYLSTFDIQVKCIHLIFPIFLTIEIPFARDSTPLYASTQNQNVRFYFILYLLLFILHFAYWTKFGI